MSRIPSNTEQFLSGLAAGTQNVGQAAQNFAITEQARLGQQQLALEQQRMLQQGQQFERGLQAESENYRRLNESRERMQQQEMAQQGAQFQQRMGFDQEQARLERMLGVKMKELEFEMMATQKEMESMASNDPRLATLRAKRRDLMSKVRNVKELVASSGQSLALAQGMRGDRLSEVDARLSAHQEALAMRSTNATDAVRNGFDFAALKDAGEGGFIKNMARAEASRAAGQGAVMVGGVQQQVATSTLGTSVDIMMDNISRFFLGSGAADPEPAKAKATEFAKNGGAMAAQTLYNAIDLTPQKFGLKPGDKEKAARLVTELVSDAAILANVDPQVAAGGAEGQQFRKERIARTIGELRKAGMGDEQLGAMFDGLEALSTNRVELMRNYSQKDLGEPEMKLLEQSLGGMGKIADVIQGVSIDEQLMRPVGGTLDDPSKYDWIGVSRRAKGAYGLSQSAEFESLVGELRGMNMGGQDVQAIVDLLSKADPNLQYLKPEDWANIIRGASSSQLDIEAELEALAEEYGRTQGSVTAGMEAAALRQGQGRLAGIEDLIGG